MANISKQIYLILSYESNFNTSYDLILKAKLFCNTMLQTCRAQKENKMRKGKIKTFYIKYRELQMYHDNYKLKVI